MAITASKVTKSVTEVSHEVFWHHPTEAQDAWRRTLDLFTKHLKG